MNIYVYTYTYICMYIMHKTAHPRVGGSPCAFSPAMFCSSGFKVSPRVTLNPGLHSAGLLAKQFLDLLAVYQLLVRVFGHGFPARHVLLLWLPGLAPPTLAYSGFWLSGCLPCL